MKELFPVGKVVKVRVLYVNFEKKLIFCTCKRSLLRDDCAVLSGYENVDKGMGVCVIGRVAIPYKGVVFDVKEYGVLVRFFNRVMGVIPSAELQRRGLRPDRFVKGKIVEVKVTEVDEKRKRLNLAPANTSIDEDVDLMVGEASLCQK